MFGLRRCAMQGFKPASLIVLIRINDLEHAIANLVAVEISSIRGVIGDQQFSLSMDASKGGNTFMHDVESEEGLEQLIGDGHGVVNVDDCEAHR